MNLRASLWVQMASVDVVPSAGVRDNNGNTIAVDKLPEEMNDMKIRDDKVDGVDLFLCRIFNLVSTSVID